MSLPYSSFTPTTTTHISKSLLSSFEQSSINSQKQQSMIGDKCSNCSTCLNKNISVTYDGGRTGKCQNCNKTLWQV